MNTDFCSGCGLPVPRGDDCQMCGDTVPLRTTPPTIKEQGISLQGIFVKVEEVHKVSKELEDAINTSIYKYTHGDNTRIQFSDMVVVLAKTAVIQEMVVKIIADIDNNEKNWSPS